LLALCSISTAFHRGHAKSKVLGQADATRAEPMTGFGVSNRSSCYTRKTPRVNQLTSPREPRRLSHAKFPGRNEEMAGHVRRMLAGGGEFCDKAQDAVGILTGCSAQLTSYFLTCNVSMVCCRIAVYSTAHASKGPLPRFLKLSIRDIVTATIIADHRSRAQSGGFLPFIN
jgi:hypothetical protein